MSYSLNDFILAVVHHLLVFALAGLLAVKIASVRPELAARDIDRLARIDVWYAALIAGVLAVGLSRIILVGDGWSHYSGNIFFWATLGSFLAIGALSVTPTLMISRWRRDVRKFATSTPCLEDVLMVRRYLWMEVVALALVLVFAAALTRGYGIAKG
jgi:putative membrane protein